MATASERVSRWARGFVAAGACWAVVWGAVALGGVPRRVEVTVALYGFVFHVLFGNAYSLLPSYFDRDLAFPRAPAVHLPLALAGTAGLAAAGFGANVLPAVVETAGALAWAAGVAVFLLTVGTTIRDNPTGRETGTGEHNAHRRRVDRAANAAVPLVLLYLAVGTYAVLAAATPLPSPLDGYPPRASHLLAAGTAALLLFAVGFRLLPRFLVATPPTALVAIVLPAGAVGPALLAVGVGGGGTLAAGAVLEAVAVAGFAAAYGWLFWTTERDRVGFYGVLTGALAGLLAVGLGLQFAFVGVETPLVVAHYRLTLVGFLGSTIVGVTYQFYPPTVARFPLGGDRTALAAVALLGLGLLSQVVGLALGASAVTLAGEGVAFAGTALYAYLLVGVFVQRARS